MIHVNAINALVQGGNEFDVAYVTKGTGRLVKGRAICTSSNFQRRTLNIRFIDSGQTRTLRSVLITEFNGTPVFI